MRLEGTTGRMDYPSLGCGGPLMLERSDGSVHYYRERITYGRDLCIDDGLIAVRLEAGSVHWRWEGSGAIAAAVLTPMCRLQSHHRTRRQPAEARGAGAAASATSSANRSTVAGAVSQAQISRQPASLRKL